MIKEEVLQQIDDLSPDQLFTHIKDGIVTLQELMENDLKVHKRKKINELLKELNQKEEDAWSEAEYGSETVLRKYISEYPNGKYIKNAKEEIRRIRKKEDENDAQKAKILDKIKNDANAYPAFKIREYINKGLIDKSDIVECGIPSEILDAIHNSQKINLELGETPNAIPKGYSEVYFWGVPGSGKTCALSALLSTAHKKGYLNMAVGPGYNYMTRLRNIFVPEIASLPAPSPVESTQFLPFTLKKPNEKYHRSISLIELSGEIFQCFYKKNASQPLPSIRHEETFNSLNRFLKGDNRKIHFFFIDYSIDNNLDSDGYTQSDYLESATTYFKNNNVFGKSTDAIYVVLTKSDLMDCSVADRIKLAKEHLNTHHFKSFINVLKDNCRKYSINGGKLYVEPFSLGSVYFKDVCDFDDSSSSRILDILFDRIPTNKKNILDVFNK